MTQGKGKWVFWGLFSVLALAVLFVAFRPDAVWVDLASATRGPLEVSITEEGKTRVKDRYQVFVPGGRAFCTGSVWMWGTGSNRGRSWPGWIPCPPVFWMPAAGLKRKPESARPARRWLRQSNRLRRPARKPIWQQRSWPGWRLLRLAVLCPKRSCSRPGLRQTGPGPFCVRRALMGK